MKTYILDSINRFKRFSERLDVATTLSNKTWVVFNDSGERELYIFQPDGSVIITSNGIGVRGQWQWIAANQSLIIHHNDTVIMLHPQYIDNTILALNLDGTRETAFLIEDKNRESFAPKSLVQLEMYFENKEQKMLLEQRREENRRAEERQRQIAQEREERRKSSIEEQKRKQENDLKNQAKMITNSLRPSDYYSGKGAYTSGYIAAAITSIIITIIVGPSPENYSSDKLIFAYIGLFFVFCLPGAIVGLLVAKLFSNSDFKNKNAEWIANIKRWEREHPGDPRNRYLYEVMETGDISNYGSVPYP